MSREQDTKTPRQRFAEWFGSETKRRMAEEDWSMSELIRRSGAGRATIYNWLSKTEKRMPNPEKLKDACEKLGLSYATATAILGRSGIDDGPGGPSALEGKIDRVNAILRMESLTEPQRGKYEAMKRGYEAAYEKMIDTIIEDFERDAAETPDEPGE